MKRYQRWAGVAILALAGGFGTGGLKAQGPPPPPHKGLFGIHRPTLPMGHRLMPMGNIIGNKKTHVYHLPSDKSALPAPQNRVYFHSVAQARAAGYHPAGQPKMGGRPTKHH